MDARVASARGRQRRARPDSREPRGEAAADDSRAQGPREEARPATSQGFRPRPRHKILAGEGTKTGQRPNSRRQARRDRAGAASAARGGEIDVAKLGNELAKCRDVFPDLILRGRGPSSRTKDAAPEKPSAPSPFPARLLVRSYVRSEDDSNSIVADPATPIGRQSRVVDLDTWAADVESLSVIGRSGPRIVNFEGAADLHLQGVVALVSSIKLRAAPSSLQHVSFSGWDAPEKDVNTAVALVAAATGDSLRSLEACDTALSDAGLVAVGKRCSVLSLLAVSGCARVTDQGIAAVIHPTSVAPKEPLRELRAAHCPKLRGRWNLLPGLHERVELGICALRICDLRGCKVLESLGVVELARSAQAELRDLDVSECVAVDDNLLQQVAIYAPSLTRLCVRACHHVTDEGLISLSTGAVSGLEVIDVSGTQVTDVGLSALAEAFSCSLRELYASMPRPVNVVRNETLLAAGTGALARLSYSKDEQKAMLQVRKLAELKQSRRGLWTAAAHDCGGASGLEGLMSSFRVLQVANHNFFQSDGLVALCANSAGMLVELCVGGVSTLTTAHLRDILGTCPRLTHLDISRCAQLGDAAARLLCESGHPLLELDISRASDEDHPPPLANITLLRVLTECRELHTLRAQNQTAFHFVSESDQQGAQRIEQVCGRGSRLQRVDFSGCTSLRREALALVTQTFKNLEKVDVSYCPQLTMNDICYARCADLVVCEDPFFGLVVNRASRREREVPKAWNRRHELEESSACKIQTRYRAYKSAPVTVEYLILCNPRLAAQSARKIQRQWRHHLAVRRLLAAVHRLWAIRVLQRMFRVRLWRRRVKEMMRDDVMKKRREILAAKIKREFFGSARVQKWYRKILWARSEDGLWHAELQRRAQEELYWRRKTKQWRADFAIVLKEAATKARAQRRFGATVLAAAFPGALEASTHKSIGGLVCGACRRVRADLWCALCRYARCDACAWRHVSHRSHVEACLNPHNPFGLFQYLGHHERDSDRTMTDAQDAVLELTSALKPLREAHIALGEARDFMQRRNEVLRELRQRFAALRAQEAASKARERRQERDKVERAALIVQRTFRRNIAGRDLAAAAAIAMRKREELARAERAVAARKIQAWARGHAPRWIYKECVRGPLRDFVDPGRRRRAAAKIYRPYLQRLARFTALGKRDEVSFVVAEVLEECKRFDDQVLKPALARAQERMATARSVLRQADKATKEAGSGPQPKSRLVAQIAMAVRDHATQSFDALDRLIRLLTTNMGDVDERRIARNLSVSEFCGARIKTLLNQVQKLENLQAKLGARREEVVRCLQEHGNVHEIFACYNDPKLRALSRTKKEIAAKHEVDWIDIKLGNRSLSEVMAELRIEEGGVSGAGVDREALASRGDHTIPAELERYWEEINLLAEFARSFARSFVEFEATRRARLRKVLPVCTYLLSFVDEARDMSIARARSDHAGDHAASLRLAKQETPIRYKIMHLHDEIKGPALDLAADIRAWEERMNSLALPTTTGAFRVTLPGTCFVQHKVSTKALEREIKAAAWTSLLPGRFFADALALEADRSLQARIQATLNARQQSKDGESDDDHDDDGDGDNDDDDEDAEEEDADLPAGVASSLVRDAKLRARADGTIVQRLRNWWYQGRDEAAGLEQSVLRRQKTVSLIFQAIAADLALTVGSLDTEEMAKEQALRREQGLPELSKYSKNLGRDVPIYLWFRTTVETDEMLTGLKLSHASPRSSLYVQNMLGWTRVEHPKMDGTPRTPALQLLHRRGQPSADEGPIMIGDDGSLIDPEELYIKAIRVSTSAEEEEAFASEGFERVGAKLSAYFLVEDAHLWVLWATPGDGTKALTESEQREILDREDLEKKLAKLEASIQAEPKKAPKLRKMALEIDAKLKKLRALNEKEHQAMVERAVEFLALTKKELAKLVRLFASMDADGSGSVSLEELLQFIGIESSDFALRVFNFLDDNHDGSIDFPEYMNILSTFCMFGNNEVTRMCFSFVGPNEDMRAPVVAVQRFLGQVHGVDVDEIPLLKASVDFLRNKATGDGLVHLDDFYSMNGQYPKSLYPAMQIRDAMRASFMGTRWWTAKLQRYAKARARLQEKQKIAEKRNKLKQLKLQQKLPAISGSSSSLSSSSSSSPSSSSSISFTQDALPPLDKEASNSKKAKHAASSKSAARKKSLRQRSLHKKGY